MMIRGRSQIVIYIYLVFAVMSCKEKPKIDCDHLLKLVKFDDKLILGQHIDSIAPLFDVHLDTESSVPLDTAVIYLNHPLSKTLTERTEMFNYYTFWVGEKSRKVLAFEVYNEYRLNYEWNEKDVPLSALDKAAIQKDMASRLQNSSFNIDALLKSAGLQDDINIQKKYCPTYSEKLEIIGYFNNINRVELKYQLRESDYLYSKVTQ
jgi:hypothetical protein